MTTELEFPFGSPTEGERKEYRSFIYRTVGWSETEKITCCLEEGARVEARFDGRDTWVGGVIETVRSNGASFDIVYEDGESEQRVPHQRVRPVETTTTEFTKKINQALLKSNTENGSDDDVKMSIDAEKDVFKKPDAKSSKNMTKKKALNNDVRSILRQEKVVQAKKNSLGAALSLLRDQGEFNNKNDILVGRKNDTKDGNVFSNINKPGDKIKLEYRDDKGRLLTPKEAFRQLSYRFHGIEPSKKTKEKRERQLNDRIDKQKSQLQKNKKLKDGGNFSSLVSGRFENKIKESQQPFVKLDI